MPICIFSSTRVLCGVAKVLIIDKIQLRFDIYTACILTNNWIILVLRDGCSPLFIQLLPWHWIIGIDLDVLVVIVDRRHVDLGSLGIDGKTMFARIVDLVWLLLLVGKPLVVQTGVVLSIGSFDVGVLKRNGLVSVPPETHRERPTVFLLNNSARFFQLIFVLIVFLQRLPHQLFILHFRLLYLFLYFDEMVLKPVDFHVSFCS